MKIINKTGLICFLLISFYFFPSAQAATLSKTAEMLPPETVFLVEVQDFSQLKSQFEQTSFYKLFKDPAMVEFFDKVKKGLKERVQKLDDNDIYKAFYNTGILPEGKLAVALILNEQSVNFEKAPVVYIIQWGRDVGKIRDAFKELIEKNTEMGGHFKGSEEYRGVSIETMLDEDSTELSYCFVDDYLIASLAGTGVVKFVVAQMKGAGSPTLADDSDYTSAVAACGPYHDIVLYLNIKKIVEMVIADDSSGEIRNYVNRLGIDNVRAFCCSVGVTRLAGNLSCAKAFLKIDGDKKGICKMLECESAPVGAPRFISLSTYSAFFLNLNIKAAFDELVKIVSSFSPGTASVFYMPLLPPATDGQLGIELKRDILEHLGSQIILTSDIGRPITEKTGEPKGLVALATTNSRALEKSLLTLHSKFIAPNRPEASYELLGHTIYLIDLSSLLQFGPAPSEQVPMQNVSIQPVRQMPKFAFTVTETHLIIGSQAAVELAIRTLDSATSESIASAKWFNAAKAAVPSDVGVAILEDSVTSAQILWQTFKKMAEKANKAGDSRSSVSVGLGLGSGIIPHPVLKQSGLVDFTLLPDFDVVRKYFCLSAFYGISRPDGYFFEMKDVPAPGE